MRALVGVFIALRILQESVARKTALAHLLDYVAVALMLWPEELCDEGVMLRDLTRVYAFGRFSTTLEQYDAERSARGYGRRSRRPSGIRRRWRG